jgi:hypothetical protein
VKRLDIIWDEYVPDSLKSMTRSKRGKGIRRRVKSDTRLPENWEAFLRVDDNKRELFGYLTEKAITVYCRPDKQVISTKGTEMLCNNRREDTHNLSPCQHEEADTSSSCMQKMMQIKVTTK